MTSPGEHPDRVAANGDDDALGKLAFLAQASELLASSLDYEATLARLADLAVPGLAAWCTIDMLGEDGTIARLAVAHSDPARVALAQELQERHPPDPNADRGVVGVVRTGRPELVTEITDELLVESTRGDEGLLRILRELGLTSYMCVPLVARDRVLGAITFVSDDPERLFDTADLELAHELARRAASAVENARLYRQLERSEARYRLLFDASPLPMWVYDWETLAFLAVNDAAVRHYGYSRDEFLAMTIAEIRPEEDVAVLLADLERSKGSPLTQVWRHRKKDGTLIDVEISAGRVVVEGRDAVLVLAHDITERKRLEEQLAQSEKMEAIGRPAGGVAHDFNNLLTVISGYASMLLARTDDAGNELTEITRAAEHASALTRQLLAFSRRQVLQPRVIDLNDVIAAMEPMLRRIIGEDVDIAVRLAPDLAPVEADPGQLERVVFNLAANARDAMPDGGQLTIETANVALDAEYVSTHMEGTQGPNVLLAVSDTGVGMSAEVRDHLFEPFFTTKEAGAGTGLGLATVFGVVKQSGGSIYVYSEEGAGTTFKLYFPAAEEADASPAAAEQEPRAARGSEAILLVEDDEMVRTLVSLMLESNGYRVLTAGSPEEAEQLCREQPDGIDLLLTDVVMPRVGGRELAQRLLELCPGMRVLFMSGYADEAVYRHGVIAPESAFIEKPFTQELLAQKLRELLEPSQ